MRAYITTSHEFYHPHYDYSDGEPFPFMDTPERMLTILAGVRAAGIEVSEITPEDHSATLFALHDREYVQALEEASAAIPEAIEWAPPGAMLVDEHSVVVPENPVWEYAGDRGTPLMPETCAAARDAFNAVCTVASRLPESGRDLAVFTRPPGHHAGRARFAGMCFFNNCAGAATILGRHGRVAVLDLDYHLGDGVLDYAGENLPYLSVHAATETSYPNREFPASEHPHARLAGLAPGAGIPEYLEALDFLLGEARAFAPDYLVVLVGFDFIATDYMQDQPMNIAPPEAARIAKRVARFPARKLFVQEGGYDLATLADTARHFFGAVVAA
ncbi:MAG: hypothetical protein ACLFOY_03670 [Desulfatibacillaceae bacterium]